MKYTDKLKLPIYDKPDEDVFDIEEWNGANNKIEKAYSDVGGMKDEVELIRDEIPKTNATAEVVQARLGRPTLADLNSKMVNDNLATDSKATQALVKAQDPMSALTSAGYRIKPSECSRELLDLMNKQGTVNIGQGLLVNQGEEYPLQRTTINGVLDQTMNGYVKNCIIDATVVNAKPGKAYQIAWAGNGYTGFGDNARYGFQINEYDVSTIASPSASKRIQVAYTDYNFDVPTGIVTRTFKGRYDNVVFVITVDYTAFGSNKFLSNSVFGSSIIHTSKYINTIADVKSMSVNKGGDYPFYKLPSSTTNLHAQVMKAILDVKVINAKPKKIYKIEWIGNGTVAWGQPEYAIYLNEYDETDLTLSSPRIVFDRNNAHLDVPASTLETRLISVEGEDVSLSVTVDYSQFTLDRYPMNTAGGAGCGHIIDKSCYLISTKKAIIPIQTPQSFPLAISYEGEQDIKIKQEYNSTGKNLVIGFGKLGINELTHFKTVSYKVEDNFTNDFTNLQEKYAITSDWISPYGMKALNNTVDTSAITVGGNHGTNNGGGFPTARHISTEVYADGNKLSVGTTGYAKELIEVVAKHAISASNVIDKATGVKRDSCIETTLYKIYKDTIYVSVTLEALEPVNITRYCGLQVTAPPLSMQNKLYFMTENRFAEYNIADYANKEILSCAKSDGDLDRFVYHGANDMFVCYRDKTVGIGDFRYIEPVDTPIYKSKATKVYMHNISQKKPVNVPLDTDDIIYWSGGYTFSSRGLVCTGSKKAYTIREKDKRVYVVDFDTPVSNTYLEVYKEDNGKFINVLSKSSTVTCDNYITSKGLKLSSTGFGQLKFTIE